MKFIQMIAAIILLSSLAFAQAPQHHKHLPAEERAQKHTDRLREKLDLGAEQANEIYAINLEAAQQMEALKEMQLENREILRQKRQEIHAQKASDIKTILDEQQLAQYESFLEKREEMKENPEMRAEKRTKKMTKQLNLTDEQYESVYQIHADAAVQIDELKDSGERDAIKQVRQETKAKLKEVLTEEQLAKLKEIRESHQH